MQPQHEREKAKLKQLLKRLRKLESLADGMHPKQLEAFRYLTREQHARLAIRSPRRTGKTVLAARTLAWCANKHPGASAAYITGSKEAARRIIWQMLIEVNAKFGLGGMPNRQSLEMRYPNGGTIYLMGADRDDITDKMRGLALTMVVIDEADFMRNIDMENYLYSVIEPTLADHRGGLLMISTPRPGNDQSFFGKASMGMIDGFKSMQFRRSDNPYTAEQMDELLKKRIAANPRFMETQTYKNEFEGEYAPDTENAVFPSLMDHTVESYKVKDSDRIVIGLKPNFYGETAIAVLACDERGRKCTVVESYCVDYRDLDDVVSKCVALMKIYPVAKYGTRIVGDFPDKLSMDHMKVRFGLPIAGYTKSDRVHWINQFNMDIDAGMIDIVIQRNRSLIDQMYNLSWVRLGGHKVTDKFNRPSSIAYALLQAYQVCYHYLEIAKTEKPKPGTPEFDKMVEEKFIEQLESEVAASTGVYNG